MVDVGYGANIWYENETDTTDENIISNFEKYFSQKENNFKDEINKLFQDWVNILIKNNTKVCRIRQR